jgi:hypothetical protein
MQNLVIRIIVNKIGLSLFRVYLHGSVSYSIYEHFIRCLDYIASADVIIMNDKTRNTCEKLFVINFNPLKPTGNYKSMYHLL